MATAASSSVGTIDVQALVSQLMSVERRPIDQLNTQVASAQTRISSFGTLKSLVSSFQTAVQGLSTSLQSYSATPSDATVLAATASATAAAGTYAINVTTLAQAQQLASAGQTSDTTALSTVASTVTFTVGTTSTNIAIGANATLQNIRDAINTANIGVTATIVNDGSSTPFRLALSANNTGTSNAISSITIQTGGDAAINNLLAYSPTANAPAPAIPMAQTAQAKDALFTVNGIQITSASNTVTSAVQGVSLTLSKVGTSNVTVARDTGAIDKAATSFVDAYNALYNQLKSRSAYGTSTSTAGALAGDSTVRLMMSQMRDILGTTATGGTLSILSQVGISTQAGGNLVFDSTKLNSAMASNMSDVTNLFNSATGFATRFNTWTTSVVGLGGLIDTRTNNIQDSIQRYNDQISRLEIQMTQLQKRYTAQYSNLNMMLSRMNDTSTYLAQQFSKASGG